MVWKCSVFAAEMLSCVSLTRPRRGATFSLSLSLYSTLSCICCGNAELRVAGTPAQRSNGVIVDLNLLPARPPSTDRRSPQSLAAELAAQVNPPPPAAAAENIHFHIFTRPHARANRQHTHARTHARTHSFENTSSTPQILYFYYTRARAPTHARTRTRRAVTPLRRPPPPPPPPPPTTHPTVRPRVNREVPT